MHHPRRKLFTDPQRDPKNNNDQQMCVQTAMYAHYLPPRERCKSQIAR